MAAGLSLAASAASASTVTLAGGGTTDDCDLANLTVSVACDGDFSTANPGGNVAGGDLDGLFALDGQILTGWSLLDQIGSVDSSGTQVSAGGLFEFTTTDRESGSWSLINPFAFAANKLYIFTLKGANDQAAYVMDGATLLGDWSNGDLLTKKFNIPQLSNVRLFEIETAVIPVPAAGFMLLLGLGGLAAVRRRKSAS
ncbi:VPLPA-CTERM sorting domain-containing protein [Ponticoccus sp. SC6-11]|nr:VPLPA-CTERM sorting domain-containing protein [Ponticoccus sp. SC6-11]